MLFDCSGQCPRLSEQGLSEVKALVEDFAPRSVTVVQFDSNVQKVDTFENGDFVSKIEFTGRGGIMRRASVQIPRPRGYCHDQIIVFTDMGIHDFPDIAPDVPVLWVSTVSDIRASEPPFGEVTYIEAAA